ncbi:GspH/FimT family pseudopilin [Tepidimonas fonticaldi]|uniref:GspH/FimT family pseudopilin n=1 Tax=Tepidimonas fonticaldi TaxID=1101373 RepID=UPI001E51C963
MTLIEAMVTVAILAILAAIAIPNMRDWIVRSRIQNTANAMRDALANAKFEAIRHGRSVEFCTDAANRRWQVRLTGPQIQVLRQGEWPASVTVTPDASLIPSGGEHCLVFRPTSIPNHDPGELWRASMDGKTCAIEVLSNVVRLTPPDCP